MEYRLDDYQEKAVTTEAKNAIVIAAPGSGKTSVIINRVAYLINVRKVSTDNIIVITFTKAAAVNMKRRYISYFKNKRTPFLVLSTVYFIRYYQDIEEI